MNDFNTRMKISLSSTPLTFCGEYGDTAMTSEARSDLEVAFRSLYPLFRRATVAVQLHNSTELACLGILAFRCPGNFAFLDPRWPREITRHALDDCAASILIVEQKVVEHFVEQGFKLKSNFGNACVLEMPGAQPPQTSKKIMLFSSGSTGFPKCIVHDKSSLLLNARMHIEAVGISKHDTILCSLPIFYSYGFVTVLLAAAISGAQLISTDTVFAEELERIIIDHRVSILPATPLSIVRLLNGSTESRWANKVKKILVGGDYISDEMLRRIQALATGEIYITYGLAEAGPRVMTAKVGSDGRYALSPLNGVTVRIEGGELLIDTPTRMVGYMEKGKLLIDAASQMESLRTGDVFEEVDGGLRFLVRSKNVISRLGDKVSLRHIEDIVRAHPRVSDARCRIGPDDTLTLSVSSNRREEPDNAPLSTRDLNQFCRKHLRSAEMPTMIEIVDQVKTK